MFKFIIFALIKALNVIIEVKRLELRNLRNLDLDRFKVLFCVLRQAFVDNWGLFYFFCIILVLIDVKEISWLDSSR